MAVNESWEHRGIKENYKDIMEIYLNDMKEFEKLEDSDLIMLKELKNKNLKIDETNLLILDVLKNYQYGRNKYCVNRNKENIELIRNYIENDKRIDYIKTPFYIYQLLEF